MTIGEKIKTLRKSNKKSQEDLASDLGVSRQTINKWETNKARPNTENVKLLCSIFGLSADYFLESEISVAESEVAASTSLPRKGTKRMVLVICSLIDGLMFLVGALFSVIFGSVVFSPNTGDKVVGTDNIEMAGFIVILILTVLFLVAEVLLLMNIFKKKRNVNQS